LYSKGLLTRGELEKISAMTDDDASERLLIYILPKKGPQAFDIFLKTLRETEGQSYIAEELLNPESHETENDMEAEETNLAAILVITALYNYYIQNHGDQIFQLKVSLLKQ
jgi:hypothetical protein